MSVLGRMQLQECLAEACGEGRCRLCDSTLGSCKLCSKSGQEVVLGLLRCQNGYRRKYAERVCGQEDYILSVRTGRNYIYILRDLLDVVDRVRYTGILCNALISEINLAFCIQSYILQQSVFLDCIVDIRLRVLIQVDNLCIAAALEVEYAVVVPAVLVVADQKTLRVCGKGGLTSSGKSEEDSGVLSFHICVCRAVHGSDALQRQIVVHHGEHTLLHLSAVPGIYDNLLAAGDVEHNCGLRVQTQLLIILYLCLGCVVYNEVRLKVLQLLSGRLNEHVRYEMSLPSHLYDETDSHACVLVRAAECVYYVQLLTRQLFLCDILYSSPCFLSCRMVVVRILRGCPPYGVLGILVHNDEFIFGGTSGIDTCHNVHCAKLALLAYFKAFQTRLCLLFEKHLVRRIVYNLCSSGDTVLS